MTNEENQLFYRLLIDHGTPECNPMISDDDLMAIAIAASRGWTLVMTDKAAERIARNLQVQIVAADDFIRQWRR